MSIIGLSVNLLLAVLLGAALWMGWRLNRRLKALRDSHDGFAIAVRELNTAAARAEQGLADLRGATDEAIDILADRIEKGRALATRLEKLTAQAPAYFGDTPEAKDEPAVDRRLGALLAAAREGRPRVERQPDRRPLPVRAVPEDDLFEDEAPLKLGALGAIRGGRQ